MPNKFLRMSATILEKTKKKRKWSSRHWNELIYFLSIHSDTYALSPCCDKSSPTSSSFGVTLIPPGQTRSITFIISAVRPNDHAKAANAQTAFSYNCAGFPNARPLSPHGVNLCSANIPVKSAPARPPIPCTPQVSSASSHFRLFLNITAA